MIEPLVKLNVAPPIPVAPIPVAIVEEKTALPAAIPAEQVTIIGGTGAGTPIQTGTVVATPDHQPNLVVTVITPAVAIAVRFANLFLTTLLGLVAAGMTPIGGKLLYTSDFTHLILLSASLSLPGAGLGLIKDLITVFGKLEGKFPLATGSI